MTRELFDAELRQLQDDVLVLGSMIEKAIIDAMESLRDGDALWSRQDRRGRHADQRQALRDRRAAIFVIAIAAADGRPTCAGSPAILFIITDLERMADHAEGIARINLMLGRRSASRGAWATSRRWPTVPSPCSATA